MPFTVIAIALAAANGQAASAAPPERPQLICREGGPAATGTRRRVGKRCKTAEEWAKEDAELDRIPPTLRITKGQEDGRPVQSPQ